VVLGGSGPDSTCNHPTSRKTSCCSSKPIDDLGLAGAIDIIPTLESRPHSNARKLKVFSLRVLLAFTIVATATPSGAGFSRNRFALPLRQLAIESWMPTGMTSIISGTFLPTAPRRKDRPIRIQESRAALSSHAESVAPLRPPARARVRFLTCFNYFALPSFPNFSATSYLPQLLFRILPFKSLRPPNEMIPSIRSVLIGATSS